MNLNCSRKLKGMGKRLCIMALAVMMVGTVISAAIPAVNAADYECGLEAHTHADECYELACTIPDGEQYGTHAHGEDCFTQVLACECAEGVEHTAECYTSEKVCTIEEGDNVLLSNHTHADACYELICTKTEHTHTEECEAAEPAPLADDNIAEGTCGNCTWVIDADGVMTIAPVEGTDGMLASGSSAGSWGWNAYRTDVTKVVVQSGVALNTITSNMFSEMSNCTSFDLSRCNASAVRYADFMFDGCTKLQTIDGTVFNDADFTSMNCMFRNCSSLTSLNVSGWNVSNASRMSGLFHGCSSLTSLDVSGWKTANVTDFSTMFYGCSSLTSLNVSGWNTSKATNLSGMFMNCGSLTSLNVSGFNTANANEIQMMFSGCSSLKALDVSGFDTSKAENMRFMFNGCSSLTSLDVSGFNTQNVEGMRGMFSGCSGLASINVSGFNTAKVTDMGLMFENCTGLTELDLSSFTNRTNTNMEDMFSGCTNLVKYKISAAWKSGSNYYFNSGFNFVNVKNGALIYTPMDGYDVKSVTVEDAAVDLDANYESYPGFAGDMKAEIVFEPSDKVYYTVSFDANGGVGSMNSQRFARGYPARLCANTFTREGGEFLGWNTDKDADTALYTDGQEVVDIVGADKKSVTLYAIWKGDYYNVTVSVAGYGGRVNPSSAVVPKGGSLDITCQCYDVIFDFVSITVNGEEVDISSLSGTSMTKVLTLENIDRDTQVVVTYGDKVIPEPPENPTPAGDPMVVFEKESKIFDIDETIKFTALGVWPADDYYPVVGDVFLVPYSWHHAELSGDWGEEVDPYFDYSASFTHSESGTYTLKVDFVSLIVTEDFDLMIGEIVTLEEEYIVRGTDPVISYQFVGEIPDGAVVPAAETIPYGTTYTAKEVTAVDGWFFDGWYTSEALTEKYSPDTIIADTVLYGTWEEDITYGALTISNTVTGEDAPADAEFVYTVTFDSTESYPYTGSAAGTIKSGDKLTLKAGESVTISDIVVGVKYTVTQDAAENFVTTPASGKAEGAIAATPAVAAFSNAYNPPVTTGTLTITNKVTGTSVDTTLKFPFKVEFDAAGSYELRVYGAGETVHAAGSTGMLGRITLSAAGSRATTSTIKSGDTIQLAHGETAVIYGLPAGTTYKVTETDQKGYKLTSTGASGTVSQDGAKASFINEKNKASTGGTNVPDTGDYGTGETVALYVMQIAMLAALLCIISMKKLKKQNESEQF